MQISLKLIQSINHAESTICIKFQLLVTFSSLFTGSSSLSVFPRGVLYAEKLVMLTGGAIYIYSKDRKSCFSAPATLFSNVRHPAIMSRSPSHLPLLVTTTTTTSAYLPGSRLRRGSFPAASLPLPAPPLCRLFALPRAAPMTLRQRLPAKGVTLLRIRCSAF